MYYYIDNFGQQQGPIAANELPRYGVTPQTQVWRQGMSEWQPAGSIAELSYFFATPPAPPPLPAYTPFQQAYKQQPYHASLPTKKSNKGWWIVGGVAAGIVLLFIIIGISMGDEDGYYEDGTVRQSVMKTKYSSLSSSEKELLNDDLFQRMDNYFLGILNDGDALMKVILLGVVSGTGDYNLLERKFGKDLEKIYEDWVTANRLDANDRKLQEYLENEFETDYMLHLVSLLMKEMGF